MAFRPDDRAGYSDGDASESALPLIQLPFTVRTGVEAPVDHGTGRSWGHRLGLWWSDVESPGSGVVVTGVKPGGPAARGDALRVGDVIVELNGDAVRNLGDVARALAIAGAGAVRLGVKRGDADDMDVAEVASPGAAAADSAAPGAGATVRAARVPTTDVSESLRRHIECILCNPVQGDVMHEGVAANPDFGCAGADLDFNNEGISLSTLRNAVIGNEPRLTDVTVSRQDITVRERGDVSIRPGVCVEAQWAATGEAIPRIELIVQDLARIRAANQMRRRVDAAKGSGT